jgi:GNAT superfamily N-acetyltransferase
LHSVDTLACSGGLRIAELDAEPVGALVFGERPSHIPPVDLPELYVNLLLTSRRHAGKQLGARLVDVAIDEARAADRDMLCVDCWASAPTLIAWYQRQGLCLFANRASKAGLPRSPGVSLAGHR